MLRKMHVSKLRPGMHVVNTGIAWTERPFLYSREGLIRNHKQLEGIREEGYLEAFIDQARSDPTPDAALHDARTAMAEALERKRTPRPAPRTALNKEIMIARGVYDGAMQCTENLAEAMGGAASMDCLRAEAHVEFLLDSVVRNPDALICLGKLREHDEYVHAHCLNVAVMALSFGTYLGLPHNVLHDLGLAAMLHDLGKVVVPKRILQKQGTLTPAEFEAIKRHPLEGYIRLTAGAAQSSGTGDMSRRGEIKGSVRPDVALGVLDHHEKRNGTGYPRGLSGDQISPLARVISIADIYDALTTEREYKSVLRPDKAMAVLYSMGTDELFKEYVTLFIRCMGVYPVGTFLRLSSGQHAIVARANPDAPHKPRVCIMMDRKMRPTLPRTVDLREAGDGMGVDRTLDHREFRVDPMRYIG